MARRAEAASGHEAIDTPVPGRFHTYPEMAAAGLWTTPSDLARWAIALTHSYHGEGGGVISQAMARQMVSKQLQQTPPYGTGFWGLGVAVNGDGDSLTFSHDGRDEGFVASLTMWPNLGRGIVIMTNGVSGGIMNEISRAFVEIYGLPGRARAEKRVVSMDTRSLGAFVGDYTLTQGRSTVVLNVTVETARGALALYDPSQKQRLLLLPLGGDAFVNLDGGNQFGFDRDATGAVKSMSIGTGAGKSVAVKR
jgi:CubicO group peptidase (beta-lactamase class C family)